jgi:hypothetical protein
MLVQLEKGKKVNVIPAGTDVTKTSNYVRAEGHNAMIVHADVTGSGAWTIKVQGALAPNDNFADMYDANGSLMSMGSISADRCQLFVGIPEYFKVVATEDTNGATIQVDVELLTV